MKSTPPSPTWTRTVLNLLEQSLRIDFSAKERVITPVFFAAIILLLFSFAIPEQPPEIRSRMMVAESLLAVFFAMQIALSRTFEAERTDRVFDHIRLSPIDSSAFIAAKMIHVLLVGGGVTLCTLVLALILQGQDFSFIGDPVVLAGCILTLLGLSGLGVLLAAITLRADGQQVLFPLLYFPLSVPVLLCSSEAIVHWLETKKWDDTMGGWSIMLLAFDAIYLTMTMLLGAESVDSGP
jgi:heme exporter protein B